MMMTDLSEDLRVLPPFLPSLSHFAVVSLALSLFNDLGGITADIRIKKYKTGNSETYIELYERDEHCNEKTIATKYLTFMPRPLRKKVLEAAYGLIYTVRRWRIRNLGLLKLQIATLIFHFRSDGTIDTVKTVQQLCLDESIDIKQRFQIACNHGLEERILQLWAEMEASGATENPDLTYNDTERFWIRLMRDGSWINCRQAIQEHFKYDLDSQQDISTKISLFFPCLKTEDRLNLFLNFGFPDEDDFRLCANMLTKEEEEKLLEGNYFLTRVLRLCLKWPLQSLFLQTAQNVWKYIDANLFKSLISEIVYENSFHEDFDYCELLGIFWSQSPDSWKESIKNNHVWGKAVDSCLRKIRRRGEKREKAVDLCRNEIRKRRKTMEEN